MHHRHSAFNLATELELIIRSPCIVVGYSVCHHVRIMCEDLAARITGHDIQWEERGGRSAEGNGAVEFDCTPFMVIGR